MNEAKEIETMDRMISSYYQKRFFTKISSNKRRTRNYRSHLNNGLIVMDPCPCSVDGVYSLGVSLQYYLGAIYLDLAQQNKGLQKNLYKDLALKQFQGKDEIEKLANTNLNQLLGYFYSNGDPLIEDTIENTVKEEQPFFNRIVVNFLEKVNLFVKSISKMKILASELEEGINQYCVALYTDLSKLYQAYKMQQAFNMLISIREATN